MASAAPPFFAATVPTATPFPLMMIAVSDWPEANNGLWCETFWSRTTCRTAQQTKAWIHPPDEALDLI